MVPRTTIRGTPARSRYRYVRRNGKRIALHRHIMEKHLGRELETWEHVHHKDGDGYNNALKNLEVMGGKAHRRHHVGEIAPNVKLTEVQVREIRASGEARAALALKYNISLNAIGSIKQRRTWRHLP